MSAKKAKNILWLVIVACNVVNSALYLSHSLGGSTRIDQTINQLGFSQSHVVVIDQTDVFLQRLPSCSWVNKPEDNPSCKNAKTYPKIYPGGNRLISG